MADLAYKVIQTVEGTEKVADLAAKLSLAEQKLQALMDAERAAVQAGAAWSASVNATAAAVGNLQQELQTAQTQLKAFKMDMGQAATQAGYLADDLQQFKNGAAAGMQAIGNNIQPLLAAIPGLAAFAPYIATAAIAVAQLYEHWDDLMGLIGQGKVKTEADEMEELGKKTHKTAEETKTLAEWKQKVKDIDAQQTDKTKEGGAAEKAAHNAIVEGPYANVRGALEKIYGKNIKNSAPAEMEQELKDAQADLDSHQRKLDSGHLTGSQTVAVQEGRDEAQARLKAANDKFAAYYGDKLNEMVLALEKDPAALKAFKDKIAKNPALLGGEENTKKFLDNLKTPEEKKQEEKQAKKDADLKKERAGDYLKEDKDLDSEIHKGLRDRRKNGQADAGALDEMVETLSKILMDKFGIDADTAHGLAHDRVHDAPKEIAKEDKDRQKKNEEVDAIIADIDDDIRKQEEKDAKAKLKRQQDWSKHIAKEEEKAKDLGDKESIWANDDVMNKIDKRMGEIREGMGGKSEVTEGGASFAAKIQSGVSSDPIAKEQLKTLNDIKDILAARNQEIQRNGQRRNLEPDPFMAMFQD